MSSGIHPYYLTLVDRLGDNRPLLTGPVPSPYTAQASPPRDRRQARRFSLWLLSVIIGAGAGVVGGRWIDVRHSRESRALHFTEERKEADDLALKVALIEKVLAGLVATVHRVVEVSAEAGDGQPSWQPADYPVVIVSVDRANLRERPDVSSRSVATVGGGTELLVLDDDGLWVQVTTPLGDQAWISKSVIRQGSGE